MGRVKLLSVNEIEGLEIMGKDNLEVCFFVVSWAIIFGIVYISKGA